MPVLYRVQMDFSDGNGWADQTDYLASDIVIKEGRDTATLGGPAPASKSSSCTAIWHNVAGRYSKRSLSTFIGAGVRMRVQWRLAAGDVWVSCFEGGLSESRSHRVGEVPVEETRWLGYLSHFTGSLPPAIYINETPASIMGSMMDIVAIPAAARDLPSYETSTYAMDVVGGYNGLQDALIRMGGFLYDTPDGKVKLELEVERVGRDDLLVSDTQSDKIYTHQNGEWDTGTDFPTGESNVRGLAVSGNGDILVVGADAFKVYRYSNGTWDAGLDLPAAATNPRGLAVAANGDILVLNNALTDKIYRYSNGVWDDGLDLPAITGLVRGLAVDGNGDILVVASFESLLYRYMNGVWDTGTMVPSGVTSAAGLSIAGNGDILLVDDATDKIYRLTAGSWDAGIDGPGPSPTLTGVGVLVIPPKPVTQRYTDGSPLPSEVAINEPQRRLLPFGVVNHIDGELEVITPAGASSTTTGSGNLYRRSAIGFTDLDFTRSLDFTAVGPVTIEWEGFLLGWAWGPYLYSQSIYVPANSTVIPASTLSTGSRTYEYSGTDPFESGGEHTYTWENLGISGGTVSIDLTGNTLRGRISVGTTGTRSSYRSGYGTREHILFVSNIVITVTDPDGIEQTVTVYPRASSRPESQALYGYRPHRVALGVTHPTVPDDTYTPDYTALESQMGAILDARQEPQPVYEIARDEDGDSALHEMFDRRLSDKVHLRLTEDYSENGEFFVEAIESTIDQAGYVRQRIWCVEAA